MSFSSYIINVNNWKLPRNWSCLEILRQREIFIAFNDGLCFPSFQFFHFVILFWNVTHTQISEACVLACRHRNLTTCVPRNNGHVCCFNFQSCTGNRELNYVKRYSRNRRARIGIQVETTCAMFELNSSSFSPRARRIKEVIASTWLFCWS